VIWVGGQLIDLEAEKVWARLREPESAVRNW
jgi:hypothetical protein